MFLYRTKISRVEPKLRLGSKLTVIFSIDTTFRFYIIQLHSTIRNHTAREMIQGYYEIFKTLSDDTVGKEERTGRERRKDRYLTSLTLILRNHFDNELVSIHSIHSKYIFLIGRFGYGLLTTRR